MEDLRDFGSELARIASPPPPPEMGLLMEDLNTSVLSSSRIHPPRIGSSHGGLRDFGSELPRKDREGDWCVDTIAVSPRIPSRSYRETQ